MRGSAVRCFNVVLLCSAVAGLVPATASAAGPRCAGAGRAVAQTGTSAARTATLCLLNRKRAAHGLGALRADAQLTQAAQGHSDDMVANRYFRHESRDGSDFGVRIRAAGWTRARRSYLLGENIAYGAGGEATPRAIVRRWMHSAEHRANILNPRFHLIGIGIAVGTPDGDDGATYSTDLGS
jgi:uncharacterized protein YkwD